MKALLFFYQIFPALLIIGYLIVTSRTTDKNDEKIAEDASDINTEDIEWEDLF